jgi:hypothetical protein
MRRKRKTKSGRKARSEFLPGRVVANHAVPVLSPAFSRADEPRTSVAVLFGDPHRSPLRRSLLCQRLILQLKEPLERIEQAMRRTFCGFAAQ